MRASPAKRFHALAAIALTLLDLGTAGSAGAVDLRSWDRKLADTERFALLADFNNEAVLDKETQLVWRRSAGSATKWFFAVHNCYSDGADGLAFGELLAAIVRSGAVPVDVRGDMSGITVSDSFENADVAVALRRVLSMNSYVMVDRTMAEHSVRALEVILLGSTGSGPIRAYADGSPRARPARAATHEPYEAQAQPDA